MIDGHPEPDGLIAELGHSYEVAARGGAEVERINVRELSFELVLRRHHAERPLEPDLLFARDAILRAQHVVWLFPDWWSGTPALLKGFCERVLTSGFAFRYRGRNQLPERLLVGRSARAIATMDSPGYWYRFVQGRPLHRSFMSQTLGFCGFSPLAMSTVHEARFLSARERSAALARVAEDAARDLRRLHASPRKFFMLAAPRSCATPPESA